jgi:Flp pilus assembly protein TadD/Zn finger protein HypA/HybF involved in hydrogenase expression
MRLRTERTAILVSWLLPLWLVSCGGEPQLGEEPRYVGSQSCAACHETEQQLHRGSHHDLAMQEVSASTVLGAFDGRSLEHYGVSYRFYQQDGAYLVDAEDAAGRLRPFRVAYVFGVTPLQQYLVPGEDGRLQVLPVCWDSRPAESGGQRWFHIYPDEAIRHDDPLHWSGAMGNWNHMCADCHSTDLRKGFDAETRSFRTTYEEIDVSCESCHGPGSWHVQWAEADARGESPKLANLGITHPLPQRANWIRMPGERHARRQPVEPDRTELRTCAHCHSRRDRGRDRIEPGEALLASHRPALLEERLYFADGQIRDEVYVWGSFLQSKMHRMGVTCSDCHDAHSTRTIATGNALCARCHDPEHFDSKAHHLHDVGTEGSQCVDCHMPERTYMVVDPRRDHSMRVPRPDLTLEIGTPNACNGCHDDKDARWAEDALAKHYGKDRLEPRPHYGQVLARAWREPAQQGDALRRLALDDEQPGIVRATAMAFLQHVPSPANAAALRAGAQSSSPLLRFGALRGSSGLPETARVELAQPLLDDSLWILRGEAARVLVPFATQLPPELRKERFAQALAGYEASQLRNADQPQANVNLGVVRQQQGRVREAQRYFERATELGPWMAPAWLYLAETLRLQDEEEQVERILREGLEHTTEPAGLHHHLGLTLVRRGRRAEAVQELRRAHELEPGNARFAYVLGAAMWSEGQREQAFALLQLSLQQHPSDRSLLSALASYARELGKSRLADEYERRLR